MFKGMIQLKNTFTLCLIIICCLDHTFPVQKPIWGYVCGGSKKEAAEESDFWCSPCRNFLSIICGEQKKNRIYPLLLRKQLWRWLARLEVVACTWSLQDQM